MTGAELREKLASMTTPELLIEAADYIADAVRAWEGEPLPSEGLGKYLASELRDRAATVDDSTHGWPTSRDPRLGPIAVGNSEEADREARAIDAGRVPVAMFDLGPEPINPRRFVP